MWKRARAAGGDERYVAGPASYIYSVKFHREKRMRTTIVIVALIGLMSIAMDMTSESGTMPDRTLIASQFSDLAAATTITTTSIALDTVEMKDHDPNPAHPMDGRWISELGSLILIGVALGGLVTATQRKARRRSERGIT
jgi:hypothetical protein